jgi:diaminohydroxyphosphoribosylaminopyrimidine deaminase / 5-amino-6-(5-phosphoribosylamino)uracil reductase
LEGTHFRPDAVSHGRSLIIRFMRSRHENGGLSPQQPTIDEEQAWTLILSAARLVRGSASLLHEGLVLRVGTALRSQSLDAMQHTRNGIVWHPESGWCLGDLVCDAQALALFELYLPLCRPNAAPVEVIAHLGQSIDGCIATANGDARFVTGEANIRHLHRMRALSDAVLVGAETVAADDPRLTTRLVPGPNPIRILIDPRRRLAARHRVFHDGEAETLVCCDVACLGSDERRVGQAELLGIPSGTSGLDLDALLATLADRGIQRIFIEGGGTTVSRFLESGRLSRLQIAVAPLLIGAGRPGVCLPSPTRLADALRPATRIFRMGEDVLYDFDLRAEAPSGCDALGSTAELARIR